MNDDTTTNDGGVRLDLLNGSRLNDVGPAEKISIILDSVRAGNIVIVGDGLTPDEKGKLIEKTMAQIQPDGFTGIEIETYQQEPQQDSGFFGRVFNKTDDHETLTVIGPANKMQTLHKDETVLRTLVTSD